VRTPLILLAPLLLIACSRVEPREAAQPAAEAAAPLTIDLHNDVTSSTLTGYDIGSTGQKKHTDIQRLKAGGVNAQFFAAYVAASYARTNQSANRALQMIDTIRHDIIGRYPGDFTLALTAADIEAAQKNGKIAALIGIEGGHAIENSLRLLRQFHALGVRYMTLTHTNTNGWADSSADAARHGGLSALGRDVVREMNRLGMMIDISHVSDKTFWAALETSAAPIIASHSSCRSVANVPRNMTDEMIGAMAKKGGVIHINLNCGFLNEASAKAESAFEKKLGRYDEAAFMKAFASGEIPRASMEDVVAHIDRAVKVGSIDSVGLGSDFDGIPCAPVGLDDVSKFPALAAALSQRGYKDEDIRKIFGGNTLRVMRAVEQVSEQMVRR
jgi:membrane dipeptidase